MDFRYGYGVHTTSTHEALTAVHVWCDAPEFSGPEYLSNLCER